MRRRRATRQGRGDRADEDPAAGLRGLASPLASSADPMDCNDMTAVMREMLVERMQIPEYLAIDTVAAADVTVGMNYFHAERREYQRTLPEASRNGTRRPWPFTS